MSTNKVQVRRACDAPARGDGNRVLVDRIWPRGLTKKKAYALVTSPTAGGPTGGAYRGWSPQLRDHLREAVDMILLHGERRHAIGLAEGPQLVGDGVRRPAQHCRQRQQLLLR